MELPVTVFIILFCQAIHISNGNIVTIDSSCQNGTTGACFTLRDCLLNLTSCFVSNSVVEFCSGEYFTENLIGFARVINRQNLTLRVKPTDTSSSETNDLASIYCSKRLGIAFMNITSLTIIGIGFHGCGYKIPSFFYNEANNRQTETYYYYFEGTKVALFLVNVFDLLINRIYVNDSDGYGLFIINALGKSSISNSQFSYNNFRALQYHQYNPTYCDAEYPQNITKCTGGNLVVLFQDKIECNVPVETYSFRVTNSTFSYGVNLDYERWGPPAYYVYNAGGLSVFTGQVTYSVSVQIDSIEAYNNIGHNGANAVVYIHDLKGINTLISIENSQFMNGNSDLKFSSNIAYAGGLYVYYGNCACAHYRTCAQHSRPVIDSRHLVLNNCTFINNHGFNGSAIYIESTVDDQNLNGQVEIASFTVRNCVIKNNTGYAGIIRTLVSRTSTDSIYKLEMFMSGTTVSHNRLMDVIYVDLIRSLPERNYLSTVGIFELNTFQFSNNTISHNSLVGLHVEFCEADFRGDSFISGNNAFGGFGGGIRLYRARMIIWIYSSITISDNRADFGSGIYVDNIFKSSSQPCFFGVERNFESHWDQRNNQIKFLENKATFAGNSVYGGHIENCTLPNSERHIPGIEAFPILFDIPWNNSLTEVSSQIHQLCFCDNGLPACDLRQKQETIFPGQEIFVPAVAVGQLEGTAPSVVLSAIVNRNSGPASFGAQQDVQQLSVVCGDLRYQIRALENSHVQINLQTSSQRQQKPTLSINSNLNLFVNITSCPLGFVQDNKTEAQGCNCIPFLRVKGVTCNIIDLTFQRTPPLWIGFENSSELILAHDSCPFDYCDRNASRFMLDTVDTLCRFQRTGILCGKCKPGLSAVFGSSRCKSCSNAYSVLILIVFIIAGFVLVLALIYLDLSVADGTINGLIFYANIVKIHQAIIFPAGHTNIVTVLISWLNLDLGIEVCFYNGFDTHTRTWLQFLFPAYVWVLIIIIIVLGWYFTIVAKIVGSNSIPVLATLLLISYTKLQRTVLESLSFTRVESHLKQTFYVWLYNGNVSYSDTKHIFLTLTACLFALGYIIPFMFIVLLGPVLQKKYSRLMLKFKLTAINDAYQGPYKTEYRWWTGFMLLVRTLLILIFTLNILGNQRLNLLFIVTVCVVILTAMWNVGKVYKVWWVNVIESFFVANLALLAGWCEYNRQSSPTYVRDQSIVAYLLTGAALLLFMVIVLSHVIIKLRGIFVKHGCVIRNRPVEVPFEELPQQVDDKTPMVTSSYIDIKELKSENENSDSHDLNNT